jgi:nucleolin
LISCQDESDDDSSEEDDGDSEDKDATKKIQAKKMMTKKADTKKEESSDSESESEMETEEPIAASKASGEKRKKEESSDEDDSDEEEEEEDEKQPQPKKTKKASSDDESEAEETKTAKASDNGTEEPVSVFVGNLSFDCDEDSLMSFFTDAGFTPTSVRIITSNGRPKGFGYADFPNSKLAQKAIKSLNETDLYGRNVRLDISNTKSNSTTPRGGRGGFGNGRGTPGSGRGGRRERPPNNSLMVFNLTVDTEPWALEEIFTGCNDVYLPKNRETGERRGFGFIRYDTVAMATKALKEHNGIEVDGQQIELRYAEDRSNDGTPSSGGRGGGRGGRGGGRGRGGRGGGFSAAKKGSIQEFKGQRISFDD